MSYTYKIMDFNIEVAECKSKKEVSICMIGVGRVTTYKKGEYESVIKRKNFHEK